MYIYGILLPIGGCTHKSEMAQLTLCNWLSNTTKACNNVINIHKLTTSYLWKRLLHAKTFVTSAMVLKLHLPRSKHRCISLQWNAANYPGLCTITHSSRADVSIQSFFVSDDRSLPYESSSIYGRTRRSGRWEPVLRGKLLHFFVLCSGSQTLGRHQHSTASCTCVNKDMSVLMLLDRTTLKVGWLVGLPLVHVKWQKREILIAAQVAFTCERFRKHSRRAYYSHLSIICGLWTWAWYLVRLSSFGLSVA